MFYIELFFGGVWFAGRAALLPARQPRAFRSVSGSVPDCQASKLRGISLLPSLRGRVRICCYAASQPASLVRPFDLRVFLLLMRCRPYSMMGAFCSVTPI